MIKIANLERKTRILPAELTIILVSTCVGVQIVGISKDVLLEGMQFAWLGVLTGGIMYYIPTLLMVKLGFHYPDKSLVEYMPRIWGRILGGGIIFFFVILFFVQNMLIMQVSTKVVTFFMFDRTPPEVINLGLLFVCIYCALQDFSIIMRVQQSIFFVTTVFLTIMWLLGLFNFKVDNLLPLWPPSGKHIISSAIASWGMYSGYEFIMMYFPLIDKKYNYKSIRRAVIWAFVLLAITFTIVTFLIIGVLSIGAAIKIPYPALLVIRSVELPGTFVERLENYLLITWIPVVFDTVAIGVYVCAEALKRYFGYFDHRPFVLLLTPLLFLGSVFLDTKAVFDNISKIASIMGLTFSFGIVPLSLVKSWWQKRGARCEV